MRQQFLVDKSGTFRHDIYKDNIKQVPTSATITVTKPGSTEVLINAASMTIAGDGQLSYALTSTHNDLAGENYKAVITYVLAGITDYLNSFYDVVNSKLLITITDDDILSELPQLRSRGHVFHGTMTGGSTTTVVDTELKVFADDYFTGGYATNLTNNEKRAVTDFVSSTGTATTATFVTANASGNKYVLQRSFTKEIERSFEKLSDLITRQGNRPHLILDSEDLREVHIMCAVAEVCKGFLQDGQNTFWWELWKDYDAKWYAMFKGIQFKYDSSDDGYISGSEATRPPRMIGRG